MVQKEFKLEILISNQRFSRDLIARSRTRRVSCNVKLYQRGIFLPIIFCRVSSTLRMNAITLSTQNFMFILAQKSVFQSLT